MRHTTAGLFREAKQKRIIYNGYKGAVKERRLEDGNFRIGYLGRIAPSKGIEALIEAFHPLDDGRTELLIGGTGEEKYVNDLKAMARGRSIRWLGYVKPELIFGRASILVIPSLWQDPAPLVAQEALAYGVPIVATRRGGLPELIEDAGLLYDPDMPGALTSILKRLRDESNVLQKIGVRAVNRARSFDYKTWLSTHENLYESL
jgi:glycosyltransferase involved in cell wall biosynthesis